MANTFTMPQLGSTMEEGTIVRWLKQEGDTVAKGEPLVEIMTDKANMEVELPFNGVLLKILAVADETVPIQKAIAMVGDALEDAAPVSPPSVQSPALQTPETHRIDISPRARRAAEQAGIAFDQLRGLGTGPGGRVVESDVAALVERQTVVPAAARATPLATRVAQDLGVPLGDLATGLPGSRVRRDDVLRYAGQQAETPPAAAALSTATRAYTSRPFSGMRRAIAENVSRSAFTAPHVTLVLEADMTECGRLRASLLPAVEQRYGVRLSFTDLIVKASALALVEHPLLNSALVENEVRIYAARNIGVAVALDEGLVVPVVRSADVKSVGELSAELKGLVDRVRSGRFTPEDTSDGTFTITNLGAFGIDTFDPVILPPQAAILGVGRIAEKPVVREGQIVARNMMSLCLSFDHRVVDGAPAARFLQAIQRLLEAPYRLLV